VDDEVRIRKAIALAKRPGSRRPTLETVIEAGVRLVSADFKAGRVYYSSDVAHFADGLPQRLPGPRSICEFRPAAIEEEIERLCRPDTDCTSWLTRVRDAGVIEYELNLLWRRVEFLGGNGESYSRTFSNEDRPETLQALESLALLGLRSAS
jgi:hypothetical protein